MQKKKKKMENAFPTDFTAFVVWDVEFNQNFQGTCDQYFVL